MIKSEGEPMNTKQLFDYTGVDSFAAAQFLERVVRVLDERKLLERGSPTHGEIHQAIAEVERRDRYIIEALKPEHTNESLLMMTINREIYRHRDRSRVSSSYSDG